MNLRKGKIVCKELLKPRSALAKLTGPLNVSNSAAGRCFAGKSKF